MLSACFVPEAGAQVSRGPVTLNGISLTPAPGTRIIVSSNAVRADGPVVVGLGSLLSFTARLAWTWTARALTLDASGGVCRPRGCRCCRRSSVEFGSEDGGRTKVTLRLELPEAAFRRLPGSPEGLTVEVSPTFSNDRGVTGAARIVVGEVYLFGKVKLEDLELAYDFGSGVFDGSVVDGPLAPRPGPRRADRSPARSASGRRRPAAGCASWACRPRTSTGTSATACSCSASAARSSAAAASMRLSANGGVSLGPRIALGSFEAEAISLDGTIALTIPTGAAPISLEITGTSKIVDIPVTQQTVKYTTPAQLEISGSIDLTVAGFGARLEQRNSFATPDAFNIEALGQVSFFGLQASAEGVFSSTGYAVCLGRPDARFGFGREWFEPVQSWSAGCDVGPFRTSASAAQAGPCDVPRRAGSQARDRRGARCRVRRRRSWSPVLTARSERRRGRARSTPRRRCSRRTRRRTRRTSRCSRRRPGRGGSAGATSVQVADGLPPVRVTARVRRGVLTWSAPGPGARAAPAVRRARARRARPTCC